MPTSPTPRHKLWRPVAVTLGIFIILVPSLLGQDADFHNAPLSAAARKNPYASQNQAIVAGKKLYASKCAKCHGDDGHGTGIVPSLVRGRTQKTPAGELFWFITRGDVDNGMPSWASLPEKQRWQVITYLKSMGASSKSRATGK